MLISSPELTGFFWPLHSTTVSILTWMCDTTLLDCPFPCFSLWALYLYGKILLWYLSISSQFIYSFLLSENTSSNWGSTPHPISHRGLGTRKKLVPLINPVLYRPLARANFCTTSNSRKRLGFATFAFFGFEKFWGRQFTTPLLRQSCRGAPALLPLPFYALRIPYRFSYS